MTRVAGAPLQSSRVSNRRSATTEPPALPTDGARRLLDGMTKAIPDRRPAEPGSASQDVDDESDEPDEGQERPNVGVGLLLRQARMDEGDVAADWRQADARASGVCEDRHGKESETEQRHPDRKRRHDGRIQLAVLGEERRAGDDDARGGYQWSRARAHRRRRPFEVLDHIGDDVVFARTGRNTLVDRLVDLVERGNGLTKQSAVEVRDPMPRPPHPAGAMGALRRPWHTPIFAKWGPKLGGMADWATISSLATAGGTLVLAAATYSAVRSSNRAARIAERAIEVGMRPVIMSSRSQDPAEKVGWQDDHWANVPGGGAYAAEADGNIYLAASVRNVGDGIAVIQGWCPYVGLDPDRPRPEPGEFRRQTRDLYIPPGDVRSEERRVG